MMDQTAIDTIQVESAERLKNTMLAIQNIVMAVNRSGDPTAQAQALIDIESLVVGALGGNQFDVDVTVQLSAENLDNAATLASAVRANLTQRFAGTRVNNIVIREIRRRAATENEEEPSTKGSWAQPILDAAANAAKEAIAENDEPTTEGPRERER